MEMMGDLNGIKRQPSPSFTQPWLRSLEEEENARMHFSTPSRIKSPVELLVSDVYDDSKITHFIKFLGIVEEM